MSESTIILQNGTLEAEIDVAGGACITRLESLVLKQGFNVLDRRGLQCWLKAGNKRDSLSGVLRRMYERKWVDAGFTVLEQSKSSVTVEIRNEYLSFTKWISLIGDTLQVEAQISNHNVAAGPTLQIEHIGQFTGGRLPGRETTVLLVQDVDGRVLETKYLEPFGQRYGEAHSPRDCQLAVGYTADDLQVTLKGSANSDCLVGFCRANIIARGVTSDRFTLEAGDSYRHAQLIQLKPLQVELSPPARTSKPRPNPATLLQGEPVFKDRWSHLCLQYDQVNPEDVKRLIGDLLAPWGYSGVIFETDRGVQSVSHPELSPPWALSRDTMLDLVAFTREHGLDVGIEFNLPGHQMETGMADAYPHFIEPQPPESRSLPLCLRSEEVRALLEELIPELLDTYAPDLWLLGGDEVQIDGEVGTMGHCPLCKGTPAYTLLGDFLQWLVSLRGSRDLCVAMFGDMFIRSDQFGPNVSGNASIGETWRALPSLPSEVEIMDWHYYPAPTYGSLDFFKEQNRTVWPVTAFHFQGIRSFLSYAQAMGIPRAVHSTWAVPNREKLPIESMVWAAVYHWMGREADDLDVQKIALEWCRGFWPGGKV